MHYTKSPSAGSQTVNQPLADVAASNPNLSTLYAALKAADLLNALKGQGPYTIFAPNNETFSKLPQNVIKDLLKPENKDKLHTILTYHILPGKFLSSNIRASKYKTLQGKDVDITLTGNNVKVNNANVIRTDILGSNGVIHIIDTVLMP